MEVYTETLFGPVDVQFPDGAIKKDRKLVRHNVLVDENDHESVFEHQFWAHSQDDSEEDYVGNDKGDNLTVIYKGGL